MNLARKKHLSSSRIIIFGFLGAILFGTFLLMLPFSSADGHMTPFLDSLFTATSAVCVTGLVVYDTASYWSLFGQFIIMLLIQTGGLGIVTIAVTTSIISGRKIGLRQRSIMQESISAPKVGGIVRLTGFILRTTFFIELSGAVLMAPTFCSDFGVKGLWLALFHSVSAFCNAGFDLMGQESPFSSLTAYSSSFIINAVIMLLIIIGGIGFLVWDDIRTNKLRINKYRMQSKVVLSATLLLIAAPAAYFCLCEFQFLPFKERLLASLFQAVTPRTAGFNTVDLTSLSSIGREITIILMLIGGSPGSTAGGMKTTTAAVLVFSAISVFRRKDDIECFDRRIPESVIKDASAVFLMYIVLFISGGIIISGIENLPLADCLFETASAIGTVGLSLGITAALGSASKIILIVLMFFGRVGGLTIIFAALSVPQHNNIAKKPQERITVG